MTLTIGTKRRNFRSLAGIGKAARMTAQVLTKSGFVRTGETMQWCEFRRQTLKCHRPTRALDGRRPGAADESAKP